MLAPGLCRPLLMNITSWKESAFLSLKSNDLPARVARALLDLIRQKGQMDYASSMRARDSRSDGKIAVGKKSVRGEGAFGLLSP